MQAPFSGGGNPSGFNASSELMMSRGGARGGGTMGMPGSTPFTPGWSGGMAWPDIFSANWGGHGGSNLGPAPSPTSSLGDPNHGWQYVAGGHGLGNIGMPSSLGNIMASFMQNGAGYSPQVLQALIAQLQPQINRGAANINEQFGSMGLGQSSPAAIGLGDYYSQVAQGEMGMGANLYEQAIQNMMGMFQDWTSLATAKMGKPSGLGGLLGGMGQLATGLGGLGLHLPALGAAITTAGV